MNLQTNIPLVPRPHGQIDYASHIVLLGSCFAENIGEKLDYFKFENTMNPFGILYHPLAIERLITRSLNDQYYENEVFQHHEIWSSFDAHSRLNATSKEALIARLNEGLTKTKTALSKATHIILTYGTSWAYRHKKLDTHVANCHKIPQDVFAKELLSPDAVETSIQNSIAQIHRINPEAQVLITISPVRHLKDGFVENTRSKAQLILAAQHVVTQMANTHYFPSYEILLDELRDYRFYADDMVHPNATAIAYIFEKFQRVWMAEEAFETMNEVDQIQKGLRHKPFNPNSASHKAFEANLAQRICRLKEKHHHISF